MNRSHSSLLYSVDSVDGSQTWVKHSHRHGVADHAYGAKTEPKRSQNGAAVDLIGIFPPKRVKEVKEVEVKDNRLRFSGFLGFSGGLPRKFDEKGFSSMLGSDDLTKKEIDLRQKKEKKRKPYRVRRRKRELRSTFCGRSPEDCTPMGCEH